MAAMGPRLDLRQAQALVMTPQLQQAIRLLALSNIEIEAFIADAVERNPLLEIAANDKEDMPDMPAEALVTAPEERRADELMGGNDPTGHALDLDMGEAYFADDSPAGGGAVAGEAHGLADSGWAAGMVSTGGEWGQDGPDLDRLAAPDISLQEHLAIQARAGAGGEKLAIVLALIEQLDENGYLLADLDELGARLGVSRAATEEGLAMLQSFDPTGVGARSLSECLALQARELDRYDPAMATLIANLDILAKGALPRLMRLCEVDEEDLRDMIAELRGYNPRPGAAFEDSDAQSIGPDLFVRDTADGGWLVEINNANLPRLLVNRTYYAELSGTGADRKTQSWLNECMADANWLVKALDQRQRTIVKVASEIVKQQQGFFRHGVSQLKPLTLKQVAEAVEMHESTVSRVTSHKYLSCTRGLFELKFFFTSAIQSSGEGDAVSAQTVKAAIRALIEAEDAKSILSDDRLVELLNGQGFDIARRTVAKYREAMGIGSSVQRRRQKALAG